MNVMIIKPLPIEIIDNHYIRRCSITRKDDDLLISQKELWFKFSNLIIPPKDDDCDSYLLALIMDSMKEERKIIINGSVSKTLLSNLVEYQWVWSTWLPSTYKIVDIVVDNIRKDKTPKDYAVCAFSGGLDSTHSVWRHSQKKCSYRSQKIHFCTMVHGFDIPLNDNKIFMNAYRKAKETLEDLHIDLESMQTNYRDISTLAWNHSHGCVLVATLSNFKHMVGTCIVPSSNSYNSIRSSIGSSPITDHLLSSHEFSVIHDGASHTRTEKAKETAEWKLGTANLRVCWEAELKDRNCGKCEKCLRTQINFLASGNPIPKCFPTPENIEEKLQNFIRQKRTTPPNSWKMILKHAEQHNIQATWMKYVQQIIKNNQNSKISKLFIKNHTLSNENLQKIIIYAKKNPIVNILLPLGSQRRKRIKKLLKKKR